MNMALGQSVMNMALGQSVIVGYDHISAEHMAACDHG